MGMMLSRKRHKAAQQAAKGAVIVPTLDETPPNLEEASEVQADLELETSLPPEADSPQPEDTSGKSKKGRSR